MPTMDPELVNEMQQNGELPSALSKVPPSLIAEMINQGELAVSTSPDGKSYSVTPTSKATASMRNDANLQRSKADLQNNPPPSSELGETFNQAGGIFSKDFSDLVQTGKDAATATLWGGTNVAASSDPDDAANIAYEATPQKQAFDQVIGVAASVANPIVAVPGIIQGVTSAATEATKPGGKSLGEQWTDFAGNKPIEAALGAGAAGYGALKLIQGVIPTAQESAEMGPPPTPEVGGTAPKELPKAINPDKGDFVQSGKNPNVYGRVVDKQGTRYTVQGPNATYSVDYADIGRHATAADINEVVDAHPDTAQVFGAGDGKGGYHFGGVEGKPFVQEAPPAQPPGPAGMGGQEPPAGVSQSAPTPAQISDASIMTAGENPGRFAPSPIRPTPGGPTSASPPSTPFYGIAPPDRPMLEDRTFQTTEQYPGMWPGTFIPSGAPPQAPGGAMVPFSDPNGLTVSTGGTPPPAPPIVPSPPPAEPPPDMPTLPRGQFKKTERGFIQIPSVQDVGDMAAQVKDATAGNLHMLTRHGSPDLVMKAREIEAAPGKAQAIIVGPMQQAANLLRNHGGAEVLPEMLTSGSLRGKAGRWNDLANDAMTKPVTFQANSTAPVAVDTDMLEAAKILQEATPARNGARKVVQNGQAYTIPSLTDRAKAAAIKAGKTGDDKPLRDLLNKAFAEAANIATASARSVVPDGKFNAIANSAPFKQALQLYKDLAESTMAASHSSNDGKFSTALGPLQTYYPLQPVDANGDPVHRVGGPSKPEFGEQANRSNHFATGQAAGYDTTMKGFEHHMTNGFRRNAVTAFIRQAKAEGILQDPAGGTPETFTNNGTPTGATHMILPNGSRHAMTRVSTSAKGDHMIAPTSIVDEMGPILHKTFPDWGKASVNFGPLTGVMNAANAMGLTGPAVMLIHTENVMSAVAHALAEAGGIPGAALNAVPLAQRIHALARMMRTNPMSPENMALTKEMAKAAVIPSEYGAQTFSKQEAEDRGAHLAYPTKQQPLLAKTSIGRYQFNGVSLGPALFGKDGLDIRGRLVLWQLARDAAGVKPGETMLNAKGEWKNPAQALAAAKSVETIGKYVAGLESKFVRFLKASGLGPTATAATTMTGNALRYWLSPKAFIRGAAIGVMSWAIMHKVVTGKYPWQTDTPFGYIPFQYKGETYYIDYLAGINTLYSRGARDTGIAGAYNAKFQRHGNARSIVDGAATGQINAALHLVAGGPGVGAVVRGATLTDPYITRITNRRTGKPDIGFMPAVDRVPNTISGGLLAHARAGLEPVSPFVSGTEQALGVGQGGQQTANMPPEMRAAAMVAQYLGTPIKMKRK